MSFRSVENPKTARVYIRVTPDEKAVIEQRANDCCLPVSDFVLRCAKSKQTRSKIDTLIINELRLFAMQLKEIYQAEKPRVANELDPVMEAVVKKMCEIGSPEYKLKKKFSEQLVKSLTDL